MAPEAPVISFALQLTGKAIKDQRRPGFFPPDYHESSTKQGCSQSLKGISLSILPSGGGYSDYALGGGLALEPFAP